MSKLETPMTRRYWETVGGTLVLEFPVVKASRSHGTERRVVDALIIPEDDRREATPEEVRLQDKDVIVVQTKAERLGMSLMGQAFFSRELVKELGPRSVRTVALLSFPRHSGQVGFAVTGGR